MAKTIQAAGILLMTRCQPQKFLLLKHSSRWDLPKGHVETGEDLVQSALRETEEETGIPATEIQLVPTFCYEIEYDVMGTRRGNYHKRVTYFLGYVETELPITLTEHGGYRWFDWPHEEKIQAETIDPLLKSVSDFLRQNCS